MRLAKRNNLHESEGQQVARYVDGLRPAIRDRIGMQVLRTLSKSENTALKAEMMKSKGYAMTFTDGMTRTMLIRLHIKKI